MPRHRREKPAGCFSEMKRIPEHDLMNDRAQAEAYAAADFSEPHDAFVSHFMSRFPDFSGGEVLDLGCGTADVIIRFANAFPGARITGVDGAQAMLDIGMRDVEKRGLSHQIRLNLCRLPDDELSSKKYDAVISNSLLHHLCDPLILWGAVAACARHRAPVFIMDLMRPDSRRNAEEMVRLYAADAPSVLQKDFYNSLLAAYTIEEIRRQLSRAGLDYLTVEAVSDRHVLVWGDKS